MPTENYKKQRDKTETSPQSILQQLRTDLGWSVGEGKAI